MLEKYGGTGILLTSGLMVATIIFAGCQDIRDPLLHDSVQQCLNCSCGECDPPQEQVDQVNLHLCRYTRDSSAADKQAQDPATYADAHNWSYATCWLNVVGTELRPSNQGGVSILPAEIEVISTEMWGYQGGTAKRIQAADDRIQWCEVLPRLDDWSATWTGSATQCSTASNVFSVSPDKVLHIGTGRVDTRAYDSVQCVVTARTTNGARFQVGVDFRPDLASPADTVVEGGFSSWTRCLQGDGARVATATECTGQSCVHDCTPPQPPYIDGFVAGETVDRGVDAGRQVCWWLPDDGVQVYVESNGTPWRDIATNQDSDDCAEVVVYDDWPLGPTKIVAKDQNGITAESPVFTVTGQPTPPPSPPGTISITGFNSGEQVERGNDSGRQVCWQASEQGVTVSVETNGVIWANVATNQSASSCEFVQVFNDWPLGSTRLVAATANSSGSSPYFMVVAPSNATNELMVYAGPTSPVSSWCPSGPVLVTWTSNGEYQSGPGQPLQVVLPPYSAGFQMVSARCGSNWYPWSPGPTAASLGFTVTYEGASIGANTLVCNDPWSSGAKLAIPVNGQTQSCPPP